MTIETRMSFPEGGTECPLDESPVPTSSIATSHAPCEISAEDTHFTILNSSCPPNVQNGNDKTKKDISSSQQRSKLRSHKTMPRQVSKSDDSSENILKAITANSNNETDENKKCTNELSSTSGMENLEDLKKPFKMKLMGGDGNREEAASRKSMRLRLRRGKWKADNSDEIFGPKKRPRYVEELTSIDFDDDKLKIMFMAVLEMSPRPNKSEVESEKPSSSTSSKIQKNDEIMGTKLEIKGGECKEMETVGSRGKLAVLVKRDYADKQISQPKIRNTLEVNKEPVLINQHGHGGSINDDDDNLEWESWVKRLSSSYKPKPVAHKSPTKKEIHESLIRLVRLGTAVKVVSSN